MFFYYLVDQRSSLTSYAVQYCDFILQVLHCLIRIVLCRTSLRNTHLSMLVLISMPLSTVGD